jgi:hypothetical protein
MRVAFSAVAALLIVAPVAAAQTEGAAPVAIPVTVGEEVTMSPIPEVVQAEAEEDAAEATSVSSEERVCRAGPRSESRLRSRQRICRTQAEWDALDRERGSASASAN